MTFVEKLDRLMKQQGLNKHTFAEKSGIPYTTIVNIYKRGYEKMYMSTMWKIGDFFDVPIDYLMRDDLERPDDFTPNGVNALFVCDTAEERELVTLFRTLGNEAQATVLATVRGFAGNPAMQKDGELAEMA